MLESEHKEEWVRRSAALNWLIQPLRRMQLIRRHRAVLPAELQGLYRRFALSSYLAMGLVGLTVVAALTAHRFC